MPSPDIHEALRRAIAKAGGQIQGDGNVFFANTFQLAEVVADGARKAVIEQQTRCRDLCIAMAEVREQDGDAQSAAALREAAAQIEQLGH